MPTWKQVALASVIALSLALVAIWCVLNLFVDGIGDPAVTNSNVVEGSVTLTRESPRQEFNVQLLLNQQELSIEDHLWFGASDRDLIQVEMRDRDGADVVIVEFDTRTTFQDTVVLDWTMGATIDGYGSLTLTVEKQDVVD